MLAALIVLLAVAIAVAVWLIWRSARRSEDLRGGLPASGLLGPDGVLDIDRSEPDAVRTALEAASLPVAVEYRPTTEADIARYSSVAVNPSVQTALVQVVRTLNPKGPTLFRVVLPEGAELVKAAGTEGFRGFSRTGGTTAHAVLVPVGAGGALAACWPVLAVAGTVTVVDMAARREQLAHQRRVEAILDRQEERHYVERIKDQRSADGQLTRAINLMLDGHNPHIELALKSADDEFHRSQQFVDSHHGILDELVEEDGKVDHRRLERALGGDTKDVSRFIRELHLSRSALAIKRKALVADAASVALGDPTNPYTAFQKHMESEARRLEEVEAAAEELTRKLSTLELKGGWRDRDKTIADKQATLRAQIAPATVEGTPELLYATTGDGEVHQLLPPDADASGSEV